jgi:peptidyl-prolyl cis-trans isomerase A (cyclophilin A)
MRKIFSWFPALILALAIASPLAAQQKTPAKKPPVRRARPVPGLYMTFYTTMGAIHCRLFEKEAPVTVRTMVGLAIGKISYIDPRTHKKVVGKRFFRGLTFHRVIPRFMIQGGDPLGTGEGSPEGPGFPYKNETSPTLTYDRPGRLGMANSGPDTNGSQFFITEVPVPRLNGGYTIWGQCRNLNVVEAIARVPRNAQNRPLTPVIIRRVSVYRIGHRPPNAPEAMPRHRHAVHHTTHRPAKSHRS